MPEKKEHQQGADERADSEPQDDERINDPLTQTATGAPKVPWQTTPEHE